MAEHKFTAITAGCGIGLFMTWQVLEDLSDGGLSFWELLFGVFFGVVCAAVAGRVGYLIMRWVWKDDDE
jgi:hypothetical protein